MDKHKILQNAKRFGIVNEAPIPDEWDKTAFSRKDAKPRFSFKKMVDYARQNASTLGRGSSRVVVEVEHQGRPTALKIAMNKKGEEQNNIEADYMMHQMYGGSVIVPVIDWDEENDMPLWIHYEKADKLSKPQFQQLTGIKFDYFISAVINRINEVKGNRSQKWYTGDVPEEEMEKINELELYHDIIDLCINFDIVPNDFVQIKNWGVYGGQPVIVDIGFSSYVMKEFYDKQKKNIR